MGTVTKCRISCTIAGRLTVRVAFRVRAPGILRVSGRNLGLLESKKLCVWLLESSASFSFKGFAHAIVYGHATMSFLKYGRQLFSTPTL